ncbi:MAG: hypothetical protein K6F53_03980 [Lachnospiraceae bacterium]|nr:hypothetical protein [Lachnospiraceae bacterium]
MSFRSFMENGRSDSYDRLSMKPLYEDHIKKEPTGFEIEIDRSKAHYEVFDRGNNFFIRLSGIAYQVAAVLFCVALVAVMLLTVSNLPPTGDPDNPANSNVVPERYIEKGIEETGAVNIVAGMILDYRAFDTLGESHVLFIASITVLILLRRDKNREKYAKEDEKHEPSGDPILQVISKVLVPVIMIFGIYVILNGHLSPGGGFSGGAIIGAALILYLNAFGFEKTEKFFTEKLYKRVTLAALAFYALAKCYSFFCGANHLDSHIPQGTPGNILSSGLILPLDIAVGCVVACTMYAFYAHFRKGGF